MHGCADLTEGSKMLHTVDLPPLRKVERLYGVNVQSHLWKTMYYTKVLKRKIKLARKRIRYLYRYEPMMYVDHENIADCLRAIKFNTDLIEETRHANNNTQT